MKYKNLFRPIKINQTIIKNRIVAAPIGDVFEEKAIGGAGIVVAGHAIVEYGRSSFASSTEPDVFSKYEVEKTVERVRKIHAGGAKASIEIFHGGRYARVLDFAVGPHDEVRKDGVVVKSMDEQMMKEVCDAYANTAKNAMDVGFDMIFLHFGHGWLPAQFLSPLFNKREDEYGGSLENRMKFPKMILEAIRNKVGPHFPIDMRISANEWVEGSIEFEDVKTFIKEVEHLIDTVQISAGLDINHEGNVHCITTNFIEHMPNLEYAAQVKKEVSIPVSVVGAVLSPQEADSIIAEGKVDFVAFGRSFIADPSWPNKAMEGRDEDISPCLRCLQCYHISTNHRNVGCSVNPRFMNEDFIPKTNTIATHRKKVVVIGGGPGGMKAAITASERGHDVTLLEKDAKLGGQLKYISKEFFKEDVKNFYNYLKAQVAKHDILVKTHCEATPVMVKEMNPDAIIIAVGANETVPPIKGIDKELVILGTQAIEIEDQLKGHIVVLGGGTVGAEIALEQSLIHKNNVSIIEMGNELATQGNMLYKIGLRQTMEKCESLTTYLNTQCIEVKDNSVVIKNKDGIVKEIPADKVIVCTGMKSLNTLAESFYGITPNVTMIGDCVKPRKIMEAVFEGHSIALNL